MPSLKELRLRIDSVKSTQKITSAMKMVAAAKLRKAQQQAENARPYAERLERTLFTLARQVASQEEVSPLLSGTGKSDVHLLVVVSSDRGLCGGFNGAIIRQTRQQIRRLRREGKEVKLYFVGRKARDVLVREFGKLIVKTRYDIAKPRLSYEAALTLSSDIQHMLLEQQFDVCTVIYNRFRSVISQEVTAEQLIPLQLPANDDGAAPESGGALYEYEPSEAAIVAALLPKNLSVQLYKALLESAASEHGARMTAMDNATRNAGDMIRRLTLNYNRSRQAHITRELIEIISGAEAL